MRMLKFRQFLSEGGNIKVGDVQAAPFKVTEKTRESTASGIHNALNDLHASFHKEHGQHLFGEKKQGLSSGSIFAGSTKQLMDTKGIPSKEFVQHKPMVGDVDVQIDKEHKEKLSNHLKSGMKLGEYTVAGTKKHGNEVSAVLQHPAGHNIQIDFEGVQYKNGEPTKSEQFLHSSNWEDTKAGIKGSHHKILINAAGGDTHKFSITHGLKSRADTTKDVGITEPEGISKGLFGDKADHSKIHSFQGVAGLIKKHIPAEQHQAIYDKFKSGVERLKGTNNDAALKHLRDTLGVKDTVSEAAKADDTHHTTIIPLTGFAPFSHMGHALDLGSKLKSLPGTHHVGISSKAAEFTPEERTNITSRQWNDPDAKFHVVKSPGETVSRAYNSLPSGGKKVLHILVGKDREEFAKGLKDSIESGKIPELGGNKFHEVHIHTPEDEERSHGMSGTNMRIAARDGNIDEFHRHLGPMFSRKEATSLMNRVKKGIDTGTIKVKR